ncbi:MAG: hypothetical protein R3D80_20020 [Paracoccaceae bacterium]
MLGFTLIGFEEGDREPELGWFLTEAAEAGLAPSRRQGRCATGGLQPSISPRL